MEKKKSDSKISDLKINQNPIIMEKNTNASMKMNKHGFMFIYETKNNCPNGDPFTKEPRFDSYIEKAMVSDLRIKRYIRDAAISLLDAPIYCQWDAISVDKIDKKTKDKSDSSEKSDKVKVSGSAVRFNQLLKQLNTPDMERKDEIREFMLNCIDVRWFGGLLTVKGKNNSFEGAIQFANLNHSLNKVRLETFQNTSVLPSDVKNSQGSIGTTSYVPYGLFVIEGWLNELTAELNKLTETDLNTMLSLLWLGVRDKNTRSKSNQTPVLLLDIEYQDFEYSFNTERTVYKPIQNLTQCVSLNTEIDERDIRSNNDYTLNLEVLLEKCKSDCVKSVNFFTENEELKNRLESIEKFNFKNLL